MSGELATTAGAGLSAGFLGADVDGLDGLAKDFAGAAEIVDMVKTACEIIVAAASIFGPFGAAFVGYLKATVIPWLSKVSMALKAMSKVLSQHSNAQREASSSSTSSSSATITVLPSYQGVGQLPSGDTRQAPALPPAVTATSPATGAAPAAGGGSTVATPPTIGGTDAASGSAAGGAATGETKASGETPFVQAVTALTGLVTAVDHLIHPGSSSGGETPTTPSDPSTPTTPSDPSTPTTPTDPTTPTTPTDPTTPTTPSDPTTPTTPSDPTTPTTPSDPTTPTTPSDPTTPTTPVLGTGGIDLSTLHPLHPGDSVGVLSIPVDISPDGKVTPLIHTPLDPVSDPAAGNTHAPTVDVAPAHSGTTSPALPASHAPAGGGSGGGSGSGGGGGSAPDTSSAPSSAPSSTTTPAAHATTAAAHPAAQAEPELRTQTIGSHDGLVTGLGQATGIGAGAAALARAVLSEAKQHGDGTVLGATPLPFEADADGAARTEIYQGAIG